ncbi:MAG: hypothetical protein K8T26_16320 [Lentisphaerae bacterium]|nr:hypothetical protein [Lentisphaerota bacterium]
MRRRATLILAVLVALPFLWQLSRCWPYTNDDAFITLRYAWNLAHGRGLVYNAGEHVEGFTSLLHTLLAAAVIAIGGGARAYATMKALGAAFGLAAVLLSASLVKTVFAGRARRDDGPIEAAAWLAAGIVAVSPAFVVNSASGLETTLFAALLALAVLLGVREVNRGMRGHASALVFAALILTRPEAPLLFAAHWSGLAVVALLPPHDASAPMELRAWRRLWRLPAVRKLLVDGLLVAGAVAGLLLFRHGYFDGEWLPNTYYAKRSGFWAPAFPYMRHGLLVPLGGLTGVALALAGLLLGRQQIPRGLIPVGAVAVTGAVLPFITGTDWMIGYRFSVPFLPLAATCAATGWGLLLRRGMALCQHDEGTTVFGTATRAASMRGERVSPVATPASSDGGRRMATWMALAVAAALALGARQHAMRLGLEGVLSLRARGYQTGHRALAAWIRDHARPSDVIALMDIGIVGYTCIDQTVLDISGLTDRHIAKSPGGFLKKSYDPAYVLDRQPDVVVLTYGAPGQSYTRPPKGTGIRYWTEVEAQLGQQPRFVRDYVRVRTPPPEDDDSAWLETFAATCGAARVFEHGHPGLYYLLAVFPRTGSASAR